MKMSANVNITMIINYLNLKMAEMKKMMYVFAAVLMVAALGSCQQDDSELILKKGDSGSEATLPPSDAGIVPLVLEGANNGGNVTCAEVAAAFELEPGYFHCGDKIDFVNGMFEGEFPEGLQVEVKDGVFVEFSMDEPIMIEDVEYVVGAAIVKGGNSASVYFYPGGSMGDKNLTAPVNRSGKPAGLSNLTFCLVKANPIVIALKTYLAVPVKGEQVSYKRIGWAVSGGLGVSTEYGLHMGYNYYDFNGINEFDLVKATLGAIGGPVGTIKASDYWVENEHFLEILLDIDEEFNYVFDDTYLYVGSLDGYEGRWYKEFPWSVEGSFADQRVFRINFSEITL